MIHKNLTPFYWAPKVTSREPPQVELAVCVRAAFKLQPDAPLEAIEDPIEQGFMTGDVFLPDDIDQEGALLYSSDFADFKLNSEVLLKGTCFPPGGAATESEVGFSVGGWSKALRVIGPRVYQPGALMGGRVSEPQPFSEMPLTWENAYGGPGLEANPVGRGFAGPEMPTVEAPGSAPKKQGARGIVPASFGPISPKWPQRAGKRGKKYGGSWRRNRAPFFSEDFDWTYFHGAPADQQIDGYLRGDEEVCFRNLHPKTPVWNTVLPGLRIRSLVKTVDGVIHEPVMFLDTLYADLDDERLYMTWRGLSPIREVDMTDVAVVLIASESMTEEPRPQAEYVALLEKHQADPVGLAAAFPAGFMEVANAVEAAELAELNGEPMPDLHAVADNLPADCPFPPWMLRAVAGDADPLGIEAEFPPGMLDPDNPDPLGIKAEGGELADPAKVDAALADLEKIKEDPEHAVEALRGIVGMLPADKQAGFAGNIDSLAKDFAAAKEQGGDDILGRAVVAASQQGGLVPVPGAASYGQMMEEANSEIAQARTRAEALEPGATKTDALANIADAEAKMAEAPPSLDAAVAQTLEPLDSVELPEMPPVPDVDGDIAAKRAELVAQEAKLREKFGDNPMLGMFGMGHRMLDNAPRVADVVPDLSPIVSSFKAAHQGLLDQGISAAALAPLAGLIGRVNALVAKVPKRAPPPDGEFALKDLRNRDFSKRDLRGEVFVRSDLTGATFADSDMTGADFRGADLTRADLTGATFTEADLSRCTLTKAVAVGVKAPRVNLIDADLGEADFTGADLEDARMEQTRMVKAKLGKASLAGADLRFADLSKSDLRDANLTGADLSMATMKLVKGDGVNLTEVLFDMAQITKCRLQGAVLRKARSSLGSLSGSNLTGADLTDCEFEKVDFMTAVLDEADFRGATVRQALMRDTQAHGTVFDGADISQCSATGTASFQRASFVGANGERSVFMDVDLTGANLQNAMLQNSYFQGANGEDADFAAAVLKGACFRKASLVRPRFAMADLCGADFNGARLDDGNFRGANCYDAKFLAARAVRCDFEDANLNSVLLDDSEASLS